MPNDAISPMIEIKLWRVELKLLLAIKTISDGSKLIAHISLFYVAKQ